MYVFVDKEDTPAIMKPDVFSLFVRSLNKLLNAFRREDLLDFGDGKKIKNANSLVPKI